MRRAFFTAFLLFNSLAILKAEDLALYGLADLVYYGPVIFIAKPLPAALYPSKSVHANKYTRRYVVQRVIRSDAILPDTIDIDYENYSNYPWNAEKPFDAVLFFGNYDTDKQDIFRPLNSGVRCFRNDSLFTPFDQNHTYLFNATPNSSLEDFITKTQRTIARVDALSTLRQIRPGAASNAAIFQWIEAHRVEIKRFEPGYWGYEANDDESYWGSLSLSVFDWIDENNVWQDSWKAMLLASDISEKGFSHSPSPDVFVHPEARAFLVQKILHEPEFREISFMTLTQCLWGFPGDEYSISVEEQSDLMELARSYLNNESMQYNALYLIEYACVAPNHQERKNISLLPDLKHLLEHCPEGGFRMHLVAVIDLMEHL